MTASTTTELESPLPSPFEFLPEHRLFVSTEGDFNSGGLVVDTRLWSDADWKRLEDAPAQTRQALAIKITQECEKDFEGFMDKFRDANESTEVELKRYLIDEDGVTEVDEDGNPT